MIKRQLYWLIQLTIQIYGQFNCVQFNFERFY